MPAFIAVSAAQAQQLPDAEAILDTLRASTAPIDNIDPSQVMIDPSIREAAGKLDDPQWATREAAMKSLLDPNVPKEQLYALLLSDAVTAEQRYRLLAVVREQLIHAPRGALGISMDGPMMMANGPVEIRVGGFVPGLPAEKILQLGDRITRVDGQRLLGSDSLQTYVQNKRPGEKVTLSILRARTDDQGNYIRDAEDHIIYDPLQVDLMLGSAELLRDPPGMPRTQSRVETARKNEAADAAVRLAPRPRLLEIEGEDTVSFGTARTGGLVVPETLDAIIEQHWAVQSILRDRYLISIGRKTNGPLVREQWESTLRSIWESAQRQDRSQQDREFLQRVAARFAQLMNP